MTRGETYITPFQDDEPSDARGFSRPRPSRLLSVFAAAVALSTGAARGEADIPTPAALSPWRFEIEGDARFLFAAAADAFGERPGDRSILAGAGAIGLEAERTWANGLQTRFGLRGARERDAFMDAPIRLGALEIGGSSLDVDQRTLLDRAFVEFSGGYGSLTLGRAAGAGDLAHVAGASASDVFSLSDDEADLSGLIAFHTRNDPSGHAAKILYETPRVLGIRLSASYAPRTRVCGYGFCADEGVEDFTDVTAIGLDLRRNFRNRLRVRFGASFTNAFDRTSVTSVSRDLRSFGLGASVGRGRAALPFIGRSDWIVGVSALRVRSGGAPPSDDDVRWTVETTLAVRKGAITLSSGFAMAEEAEDAAFAHHSAVRWRVDKAVSLEANVLWAVGGDEAAPIRGAREGGVLVGIGASLSF